MKFKKGAWRGPNTFMFVRVRAEPSPPPFRRISKVKNVAIGLLKGSHKFLIFLQIFLMDLWLDLNRNKSWLWGQ